MNHREKRERPEAAADATGTAPGAPIGQVRPEFDPSQAIESLITAINKLAERESIEPAEFVIAVVDWHIATVRGLLDPLSFVRQADACFRLADRNLDLRGKLDELALQFIKNASDVEAAMRELRLAALALARVPSAGANPTTSQDDR